MTIEEVQVKECAREIKEYCKKHPCTQCIFLDDFGYCKFKDVYGGLTPEEWELPTELKK